MANPYAQYQTSSIMTASPAELTLMLYNGAIKFCNQAIEAIEKKQPQESHNYILRAQNIIEELRATLDTKYSIASEMEAIYIFIYQLLVDANIEKSIQKLQDAADLIREFRDVWQEAMKVKKHA
ncbi:flagellar export chaperone FliS [Cellulosilyticum sp. I15G10I2]|uniref:flagellar export chaperone FliS n=1 Tax=Cellulosilyticum sp. I15G10I2 TaxID=1892843 RepID=UPI00085BF154|nr:flagellar export chaperone FliS [Cellulosilyticum sp. I15G10I2]